MAVRRAYSGAPVQTTLADAITSTSLTFNITDATGWPSGAPFFVVVDPGQTGEEKVLCTRSGTTLSVASTADRGADGTSAAAHAPGAVIYPCVSAKDLDEANEAAVALTDGIVAANIAADAVTTVKILDANVTTGKLASNAVTTVKITDANVTTAKLADGAVTTAKITDANITTDKLASNAVTTVKISDGNVTTAKIADGNVTTAKIADVNVTTGKIADSAVTTAKINNGAVTTAKVEATFSQPRVGCILTYNTTSTISDSTMVSSWTEVSDSDGFYTSGSYLTIPAGLGGLYLISASYYQAGSPTYPASIKVGGYTSTYLSALVSPVYLEPPKIAEISSTTYYVRDVGALTTPVSMTALRVLAAGDTICASIHSGVSTAKGMNIVLTVLRVAL